MTQRTAGTKGAVAITGGASGIGFSTAQLLMARGWQPWLLDLKREALDAACEKLGIDASRGIVCNVADETSIEEAFAALTSDGADLVAVVNSAGIGIDKLSVDTSVEEFRRIVDVNLVGSFAVARTAARYWLDRAISGSIVNISSVSGMCGNRGRSAYGASKGGVNLLTMVMANELGQSGIRVNAIGPGSIATDILAGVNSDAAAKRRLLSRTPLKRIGDPAEIAAIAAFLVAAPSRVEGIRLALVRRVFHQQVAAADQTADARLRKPANPQGFALRMHFCLHAGHRQGLLSRLQAVAANVGRAARRVGNHYRTVAQQRFAGQKPLGLRQGMPW